jgi:hypothetical protein
VRRYLVVANQTLGGEQLLAAIRRRSRAGPAHFHVVVPATPVERLDPEYLAAARREARADQAGEQEHPELVEARHALEDEIGEARVVRATEDEGRLLARQRLRHELERLRELEVDVSGEICVADPVEAIGTVLHRYEFDEIILSMLPGRRSRWLATGLPRKVQRAFGIPVTQVVGVRTPDTATSQS